MIENQSKTIIVVLVVVLITVAAAGFWYWSKSRPQSSLSSSGASLPKSTESKSAEREEKKLQENVAGGLGASIFEKSQNPIVDKLSETNPFGKVKINPLKSIYTNPFD